MDGVNFKNSCCLSVVALVIVGVNFMKLNSRICKMIDQIRVYGMSSKNIEMGFIRTTTLHDRNIGTSTLGEIYALTDQRIEI